MFPDVPDMWAKDAVASLAAKGILEGYPDGTFKGDRAATRYEVATIVARLLAKMEQEHATFATKADLDALRRVVNQLKDELDALGVRVQNIEDNVSRLDKRVTELERITFYGSLDTRFVSMRMTNTGLSTGTNSTDASIVTANQHGQLFNTGIGGPFPGAAIAGLGAAPTALTGVGVPAAFISGKAKGLPAALAGRPIFLNEFKPNTANFNVNAVTSGANPSYNLVVGSTYSVGGNSFAAPSGNALSGNPFLGTTGVTGPTGIPIPYAVPMVPPTVENLTGRPWTQGTGFSGQGILGLRIKLNPQMEAGAEFAAYYSTGDPIVDAFYGVSAVRQANVFASNQGLSASTGANAGLSVDGGQGAANNPWSRMVIDNFWFLHKPSNIKVQIGAYGDTNMDPLVYQPEANPNLWGPRYLDNYGFRVSGKSHLLAPFEWEVFGSNVADGNQLLTNFPGLVAATGATPYKPYLWGIDGKWTIGHEGNQARFKFNLLRVWDDNAAGGATTVGSIVGVNGVWVDWANPKGFYAGQLAPSFKGSAAAGAFASSNAGKVAGIGSTTDLRPIIPNIPGNGGPLTPGGIPTAPAFGIDQTGSGLFGTVTMPLLGALGSPLVGGAPTSSFGPQSMFTWGVSGGWDYTWNNDVKMRLFGEYANSAYKPSANSPYNAPLGKALRMGFGFDLFNDYSVDTEYIAVNSFFNTYIMQYPRVNGVGVPNGATTIDLAWKPTLFPIDDKDTYPNNRVGYRFKFKFTPIDPKDGKRKTAFYVDYNNLQQDKTTLQPVRFSPGSISTGSIVPGTGTGGVPALFNPNSVIPNGFVLGLLPGALDVVFTGYSPSSFKGYTGSYAPSKVNQFATPLENPIGRVTNWGGGLNYRFDQLGGLGVHFDYRQAQFVRPSMLTPQFGGSENNINLHLNGWLAAMMYPINERLSLKGGFAFTHADGHFDAVGLYRNFALDTHSINFQTINEDQSSPFIGMDYDVAKNVNWSVLAKWLDSHDNLGTFSTPTFFLQRNPFSWSGMQVTSQIKVGF